MKRAFKCPGMPAVPIIGIIIYFTYGGKKASDFPCQETLKQALDEQEHENKTE